MVLGRILGSSCCDGEDTSRSENETRLVAAGPPGWAVASMTIVPGPGGVPWHHGLPSLASTAVAMGKENTGASKDFFLNFKIVSKEISSPCKNSFGKTIGAPKTASAGERPLSSLSCAQRPRSTQSP